MTMNEIATGIVFQEEGQAMTNSIIVAREFNKEHRHVLDAIRKLIAGSAQNSAYPQNTFREEFYTNGQNGQQYPMYVMTRDGFTLLAMGFTGERALEFKMKFLQAFNAMQQMLSSDEYILMRSQQIMKRLNDQLNQRVQMLESRNAVLAEENKALAPKAQYTDQVLQAKDTYTHSEMAKELNFKSWVAFIDACKKDGILFKQSGIYMLYSKYAGNGYMKTRTTPYQKSDGSIGTNTISVWTETGRKFLHEHFNVEMQPVEFTMFEPIP